MTGSPLRRKDRGCECRDIAEETLQRNWRQGPGTNELGVGVGRRWVRRKMLRLARERAGREGRQRFELAWSLPKEGGGSPGAEQGCLHLRPSAVGGRGARKTSWECGGNTHLERQGAERCPERRVWLGPPRAASPAASPAAIRQLQPHAPAAVGAGAAPGPSGGQQVGHRRRPWVRACAGAIRSPYKLEVLWMSSKVSF